MELADLCFTMNPKYRMPAPTLPDCYRTIKFYDFPDNVRNMIYNLAIFDHDRGVVLLPRALPRKNVKDEDVLLQSKRWLDVDGKYVPWWVLVEGEDQGDESEVVHEEAEEDMAAGSWREDILATSSTEAACDVAVDKTVSGLDSEGKSVDVDGGRTVTSITWIVANGETSESEVGNREEEEEAKVHVVEEPSVSDDDDDLPIADYQTIVDDRNTLAEYDSPSDRPATHFAIDPDVTLEDWEKHSAAWEADSDALSDDMEHINTLSEIGMLYEPLEPAILCVSKQVRAESRPVYFANNAFSWRFQWDKITESTLQFEHWVEKSVAEHSIQLKNLSFECRHLIEEGINFEADITFSTVSPYFHVEAAYDEGYEDDSDVVLDLFLDKLRQALVFSLWQMASKSHGCQLRLGRSELCELGRIFVAAMKSKPGEQLVPKHPTAVLHV